MKTFHFFSTILVLLLDTSLLLSCGSQTKESESISTSATSDNVFKQELQEQVSDIMDENNKAEQQWKELEEERKAEEKAAQKQLERERLEQERRASAAPYGYDKDGVPYASQDWKNLDKAFERFEKARQGYINATYSRNPMDLMYYHQRMKLEIGSCLGIAKRIGDKDIIEEMKKLDRQVDNLKY